MEDNITLSLSGPPSSSQSSNCSSKKPKRKEISSIVSRLISQAEEARGIKSEPSTSNIFPKQEEPMETKPELPLSLLTGSKRRKPQMVQKVSEHEPPLPSTSKPTPYSITGILEKKDVSSTMFSSINALI